MSGFTGTLSLSGANAASFQLVGNNLETKGLVAPGTYNVNVVATQPGAAGSPFTQGETITGTSPGTEAPSGTDVPTVGPTINASPTPGSPGTGNILSISSGAQILLNGALLGGSAVTELYYTNHTAYQLGSGSWFGPITASSVGSSVANPKQSITPILGAFIGDGATPNGQTNYTSFVAAMGQAPVLCDTFLDPTQPLSGWAAVASYSAFGVQTINNTNGSQMIPCVGIPMTLTGNTADTDFQAIASGTWDAAINASFDQYATVNHGFGTAFNAFWVRPGWEMNGNWFPWSVTNATAAHFVAAFQRIANLAHAYTNATIQVVWNPGNVSGFVNYQSIYPGNAYVDSIGIDTYGVAGGGIADTSPFDVSADPTNFTLKNAIAMCLANGKPLSLPEVGGGPGDATFPANLASVISSSGVPVSSVIIWDDASGGQSNLHWSDNTTSATAWKSAFAQIVAG